MPDLAEWRGYAKEYKGNVVIWIDQSDAPNLKAVNSEGVCAAITTDWIASCRKYRSDRAAFVQRFRKYRADGSLEAYSIPDLYLARQDQLRREFNDFKLRRAAIIKKTIAYKKEFPKETLFLAALRETIRIFERVHEGGADCIKYSKVGSMDEVVLELSTQTTPGFYALSLRRDGGGGHIVGFEFRPDQSSPSFPEIYQFIDANFGLFVFSNPIDMMDFFEKKVWNTYYKTKYTRFSLSEYDIGLGGFGLSPDEQKKLEQEALDKELAEFEEELERELGKD